MENEELLSKIKNVKNNLVSVKHKLKSVQDILSESITFDNKAYKSDTISNFNEKITIQINNLETKIIPKINNM